MAPVHFTTRAPTRGNFGAQWQGVSTGCLRFVIRVAHGRRKTRFWLLARLFQAGLATRRVPTKGFRFATYIPCSFPKLSWRRMRPLFVPHLFVPSFPTSF